MKFWFNLVLMVVLCLSYSFGQEAATKIPKSLIAGRIDTEIQIDGILDDAPGQTQQLPLTLYSWNLIPESLQCKKRKLKFYMMMLPFTSVQPCAILQENQSIQNFQSVIS